jgi:hypothetical protein
MAKCQHCQDLIDIDDPLSTGIESFHSTGRVDRRETAISHICLAGKLPKLPHHVAGHATGLVHSIELHRDLRGTRPRNKNYQIFEDGTRCAQALQS